MATANINPVNDNDIRGSAPTVVNNGVTSTVGYSSKGGFPRRTTSVWPLTGLSGAVSNATLTRNAAFGTGVTTKTAKVKRLTRDQEIVEAQCTWNEYASGSSWTAPGGDFVETNAASYVMPEGTGLFDVDITAIVQARITAIVEGGLEDADAYLGLIDIADDETSSGALLTTSSKDAGALIPEIEITYTPAPVDGLMLKSASDTPVGNRRAVLSAISGDWNWAAGDELVFEYSPNSDMSGSSTTTPIDLESVVEDQELTAEVTWDGVGHTVYWRAIVTIAAGAGISYTQSTQSLATPIHPNAARYASVDMSPYLNPLDGAILLDVPGLALPTTTDVDMRIILGNLDFSGYSTAVAELVYAADEATLISSPTTVEFSVAGVGDGDLTGISAGLGEPFYAPVEGSDTFVYYVKITLDSDEYRTPTIRGSFTLVGAPCRDENLGDDHAIVALNASVTAQAAQAEALQVWRSTHDAISEGCDHPTNPVRLIRSRGDGPEYALETDNLNAVVGVTSGRLWPIATDGSGLSDSPTTNLVETEAQANATVLAWLCQGHCPYEKAALLVTFGNHGGSATASLLACRDLMLAALAKYRLIPHEVDYRGYSAPEYDGQMVGDFAYDLGFKRICVINAWYDCASTIDADNTTAVSDPADATMRTERLDWFKADVAATTQPFYELDIHNSINGGSGGASPIPTPTPFSPLYCRSDVNDVEDNFFAIIAAYLRLWFYLRVIVTFCHDHIHDHFENDGINYVYFATSGGLASQNGGDPRVSIFGPYWDTGFGQPPNGLHLGSDSPNSKGNAGHYLTITDEITNAVTSAWQYITERIHTSPTDFFTQGNTASFADGEIVASETLTAYRYDDPVASISDPFNEAVEDSVAMVTAGTEQDPLDPEEPGKHAWNRSAQQWKNYSSDGSKFLAVRLSPIDGTTTALTSKRPEGAGAGYAVQGMRRRFSTVNRRITVDARVQGEPSDFIGMIGVCGSDADPNFAGTAVGLGLFMIYEDTRTSIYFDDGDTVELLGGPDLTSISETFSTLTLELVGRKFTVKQGPAVLATIFLTQAQRDWLDEAGNDWVSLAARTNNVTGEGFVVEWQNFEAEEANPFFGRRRQRARIR